MLRPPGSCTTSQRSLCIFVYRNTWPCLGFQRNELQCFCFDVFYFFSVFLFFFYPRLSSALLLLPSLIPFDPLSVSPFFCLFLPPSFSLNPLSLFLRPPSLSLCLSTLPKIFVTMGSEIVLDFCLLFFPRANNVK